MSNYKIFTHSYHVISPGQGGDSFSLSEGYYATGGGFFWEPDTNGHKFYPDTLAPCAGWGTDGTGWECGGYFEGSGYLNFYCMAIDSVTDTSDTNV